MADWYVSSVVYAAIPVWAATTAYTVGQFVKPTAPTIALQYVFRCTVAGTSGGTEPTWSGALGNNATIASGGATFTNVSGQSAYGWSAAAGNLWSVTYPQSTARIVAGDRVFLSSDHSETVTGAGQHGIAGSSAAFGLVQIVSVNRAGSLPPAAADIQAGASIIGNGSSGVILDAYCDVFWQGITFTASLTSSSAFISFNGGTSNVFKGHYLKDCALKITGTNAAQRITSSSGGTRITLDNTTIQFGAAGQFIGSGSAIPWELIWLNTPSAIQGGTVPSTLFLPSNTGNGNYFTCRGIDLSAITGTLQGYSIAAGGTAKALFDSCKIASGVVRLPASPAAGAATADEVELVNCYDGTSVINERYTAAGAVTTDSSTYLSGGAQDDIGAYGLKLVSSSRADRSVLTLDSFWLDVENTAIGASKTATVEIISSASLNSDDISLLLEYMGTSGTSVASLASSLPVVLATGTALPSSSATWTGPPATPVTQKLQVTFTPQRAGRVRGLVRLGKVSTTVWINPQITIT